MADNVVTPPRTPTLEELYLEHVDHLQRAYAHALAQAGFDALVIHSGVAGKQSPFDDQYWPFRPTPAFAHWLPLREPGVTLLVQAGSRPRLMYRQVEDFWEGQVEPESHHFEGSFDRLEPRHANDMRAALPAGRIAFIGDVASPAGALGIAPEAVNPSALVGALDAVRARKTGYERTCIAEANRRAAPGHAALAEAFAAGHHSELRLHLLYLERTGQDDTQTPYKNIVAMDENAAVLHHVHYRLTPPVSDEQGHSLLVDAGATCLGYASDITRTMAKGRGSEVFAELIRRLEGLQAEIIRRIRPGLAYESLHDQAHELLAPILRDLGIAGAAVSEEELVQSGATRAFLPHGLGHSLGIQVHDVGCRAKEPRPENRFLRNTSDIEVGQVFTIEPGCYFIAPLLQELRQQPVAAHIDWALVDRLSRFGGVRIEDNIAITDAGTVNMTRDNWPSTP